MSLSGSTPEQQYQHRPDLQLLGDLGEILKREGYAKLCSDPSSLGSTLDVSRWAGLTVMLWSAFSVALVTADALGGADVGIALLMGAALFAAIFAAGVALVRVWEAGADILVWIVLLLIPATFAWQWIADGIESTRTTHLLPLTIAAAALLLSPLSRIQRPSGSRVSRIGNVLAAAPWLVPITLLIVVVPLFSEDLWRLASEVSFLRVVELASVTVVPMVVFVLWRLLVQQFDDVVKRAAATVAERPSEAVREVIDEIALKSRRITGLGRLGADVSRAWRRVFGGSSSKPEDLDAAAATRTLEESYRAPAFDYYVSYVGAHLRGTFGLQMVTRILLLVCAVLIGSTLYIYTIAGIAISAERARIWTGHATVSTLDTWFGFAVPTGPHLWVASVMAVISTAIFLALVITTQEMETAFQQSATRGPVQRCLALAVPFAKLFADGGRSTLHPIEGPSGSETVSGIPTPKLELVSPGRAARWYAWKAEDTGRVWFGADAKGWETSIAVYVHGDRLTPVDRETPGHASGRFSFEAKAGTDYRIMVDGFKDSADPEDEAIQFSWLLNDELSAAFPLRGASGSVHGHNRHAKREAGERQHAGMAGGASVWYRWTAPATGRATFNTAGSSFDTLLAVYQGPSMKELEEIESNDDDDELGLQSRVDLDVMEGEEYLIAVDGHEGATGAVVLNWGPPANGSLATAQPLEGRFGYVPDGNTTGASSEDWEPQHAGLPGGASIWYRWRAPADGIVTFSSGSMDFETLLSVYRTRAEGGLTEVDADRNALHSSAHSEVTIVAEESVEYVIAIDGYNGATGAVWLGWYYPPPNDRLEAAEEIENPSGLLEGHNRGATKEQGEPDHAGSAGGPSVWYRWRAPVAGEVTFETAGSGFDTLLAVYRGSEMETLEEVASNSPPDFSAPVRFEASEGETYLIAVDGDEGQMGEIVLRWHSPPSNDDFEAAEAIHGEHGTAHGHNRGAGEQEGEPLHADTVGGRSIWYRWRSPGDGEATFDTVGSGFDTLLAVYRGDAIDDLEPVAANDDAPGLGVLSLVRFAAEKGTEYAIAVAGYEGRSGDVALNWVLVAPPGNHDFADAARISGSSGTVRGTNRGAGREPDEPVHADRPGGASIWYRWQAPHAGAAVFDTYGSRFDTLLAVYRGSSLGELEEVAANDDADVVGEYSRVELAAEAGDEYYIAIDGYLGASGASVLRWELSQG